MALPGFIASLVVTRSVPVIASVVLHASIAAGLVASAAGHSRAQGTPVATLEVDVDLASTEEPLLAPVEPPKAREDKEEPASNHTHPYPVAPSHDARPHDPSLKHDHDDHDHDDHAEPAAAAPALVADGPAVMPRFTMSTGSGNPTGSTVSAIGTGTGSGTVPAANAGDDNVTHSVSTVQVAARLVRSVAAAYPAHARSDEVEGDVAVEIVVDREGRVVDARVTRPAGHGFDEAALVAVRAYHFSPAQREGHAVRVRMPWSVQFRLR